ncbi:hypothetical protein NPIL_80651, partial [Nephila pilipes]
SANVVHVEPVSFVMDAKLAYVKKNMLKEMEDVQKRAGIMEIVTMEVGVWITTEVNSVTAFGD